MSNGGPVNNPENNDPYKFYFQIDTEWVKKYMDSLLNKIEYKWISKDIIEDAFKNLPTYNALLLPKGFSPIALPVSSWNPNTGNDKFQYLGSNYAGLPIWKSVYLVFNKINSEYKSHIQSHAKHFIEQPHYYKGLFDILN